MLKNYYLINLAFVITCAFIFFAYLNKTLISNKQSQALQRWLIGWVGWAFYDYLIFFIAKEYPSTTAFWHYRVFSFLFLIVPALGMELILILIRPIKKLDRLIVYTPFVLLYIAALILPEYVSPKVFGIIIKPTYAPPFWNLSFLALSGLFTVFLLTYLALDILYKAKGHEKKEKALLLIGGILSFSGIGLGQYLAKQNHAIPLFGNLSCVFISVSAFWTIKQGGSLFSSEAKETLLFNKTPNGLARIHQGRIIWANPGLARLLSQKTPQSLQGRKINDFLIFEGSLHNVSREIVQAIDENREINGQVELKSVYGNPTSCLARVTHIDQQNPNQGVLLVLTDLGNIRELQHELQVSESRYRTLIEQALELIIVIQNGYVTFANPAALTFAKSSSREIKILNLESIVFSKDLEIVKKNLQQVLSGEDKSEIIRARLINKDSEIIWTDMVARKVDWEGNIALQVVFRNVTERIRLEEELKRLASTDPLTGAFNRRTLHQKGQEELIRCRRYEIPFTILMIDIDHFKKINDTWGHFAGDEVLKSLVVTCLSILRETDIFGRLGGEEFVAVLTESDLKQAKNVAERLRNSLSELVVECEPEPIMFTVSIGIASYEHGDAFIEEVINRADQAMYLAKERGRNQVAIC